MAPLPKPLAELPMCWAVAAMRTLKASRLEVLLARLFGKRFTGEDMGNTVVGHEWRGRFYLTDYRHHQ